MAAAIAPAAIASQLARHLSRSWSSMTAMLPNYQNMYGLRFSLGDYGGTSMLGIDDCFYDVSEQGNGRLLATADEQTRRGVHRTLNGSTPLYT